MRKNPHARGGIRSRRPSGRRAAEDPSLQLSNTLNRRQLLKLGALATAVAAAGAAQAACSKPGPPVPMTPGGFLTADEFALVDELSEIIIPTDEHSPGARAAKVATFIDARLAEAFEESERTAMRDGLKRVEQMSQQLNSKKFMQASADQRIAVLTKMAQNESKPTTPEETFFVDLKERVVHAYYSSEIGIKQEMEYKGNVYLPEFVGTDVSTS